MIKKIYLVGNPNVGKSLVFSRLTGVHTVVSNFAGTTLEVTKDLIEYESAKIEILDLPGIYSLEGESKADELVSQVLAKENKDEVVIFNVIDSTNLERNLYLTLQLLEQGFSLVLCLNMCDEMKHRGIQIDIEKMQEILDVPVVFTCAVTGNGIKNIIDKIKQAKKKEVVSRTHEQRWVEIGKIVESVQKLTHKHHSFREVLEDISINPYTGFLVAGVVLFSSFKVITLFAKFLIEKIFDPLFFDFYQPVLVNLSNYLGGDGFWHHLFIGDLINGKIDFEQSMGVLTTAPYIEIAMVLPYIISFYMVLSLLEDIGFLPRFALLLDNIFHKLGLHGYAIIPILLGFGCNVPGIISTRMLESKRERFIVSVLISIGVPCVTLQAMILGLLGKISGFYVAGVYGVLFFLWLVLGFFLNKIMKGDSPELLIEIPSYKFPPVWLLLKKIFSRIFGFLLEAFPLVLLGVLFVNILFYFNLLNAVTNIFSPVIQGLFGLPKESVIALVMGLLRKDVAVAMLVPLHLSAKQLFISVTLLAISFPCIATFIVLLKELGIRYFLKAVLLMVGIGIIVGVVLNLGIR